MPAAAISAKSLATRDGPGNCTPSRIRRERAVGDALHQKARALDLEKLAVDARLRVCSTGGVA